MIEIKVGHIQTPIDNSEASILFNRLNNLLDKTKFFGRIELTYEAGILKHIKATQNFTPSSLANYLEI